MSFEGRTDIGRYRAVSATGWTAKKNHLPQPGLFNHKSAEESGPQRANRRRLSDTRMASLIHCLSTFALCVFSPLCKWEDEGAILSDTSDSRPLYDQPLIKRLLHTLLRHFTVLLHCIGLGWICNEAIWRRSRETGLICPQGHSPGLLPFLSFLGDNFFWYISFFGQFAPIPYFYPLRFANPLKERSLLY